jgi:hypothetical protein
VIAEALLLELNDDGIVAPRTPRACRPGTIGMREVWSEEDQVSRPIIANAIADHALSFAVGNQSEFKFRMVVPIEREFPLAPFVGGE